MNMYVLDTDILSQEHRGNERVHRRLKIVEVEARFITIVTVEEIMRGCLAEIHASARNPGRLIFAYARLQNLSEFLRDWQVLPFDQDVANTFADLAKRRLRVNTNDLRIAAIALTRDLTVVTANTRDFARVPGLRIEDWTR